MEYIFMVTVTVRLLVTIVICFANENILFLLKEFFTRHFSSDPFMDVTLSQGYSINKRVAGLKE